MGGIGEEKTAIYISMYIFHCMVQVAECPDVIGTKVLKAFLLAIHSHLYLQIILPPPLPPLSKTSFKLVCNIKIVYGTSSYVQKPQQNYTFMNSVLIHVNETRVDKFYFRWRYSEEQPGIVAEASTQMHDYV